MSIPEASAPPPVAEPDILHGELLERCEALITDALAGSTYAATKLANALGDYAPGLIPQLMNRCGRALERRLSDA